MSSWLAERRRRYTDDVPKALEARVRSLCLALPDAHEEAAWVGTRWRIRTKTFAHVLGLAWQRVQFTSDMLPSDVLGRPAMKSPTRCAGAAYVPPPATNAADSHLR